MTTTTISTIDTDDSDEWQFEPSDAIASSPHPDSATMWADCIASLRRIRRFAPRIPEPLPTNAAIDAALRYLDAVRQETPWATPAWIRPDPEGGIILEWHDSDDGATSTDTVTFFNNGVCETIRFTDDVAVRIETDRWD